MLQTLRYYGRIYLLITSQYIKARMQYRADFIISAIGMAFSCLTSLFVFWVIFTSIPNLAGWSFNELVFMYAFYLLAVSPMQVFFDNMWNLRNHVQSGTFIRYYFRPLNMMFYFVSDVFDIKGLTQVAIGILAFIYASIQLHLSWTLFQLFLLVMSVFSASLVIISIMGIAACSAFWIINSFSIISLAFKLREFSPYPMTIFDGFFRFVFTYLIPLGFVAFYPAQFFLRPNDVNILVYLSPLVGIGLFVLMYRVWVRGVNSYSGTGS